MHEEIIQLAADLAQQLLECQALSTAWLLKAGQILNDHQRQLPHTTNEQTGIRFCHA